MVVSHPKRWRSLYCYYLSKERETSLHSHALDTLKKRTQGHVSVCLRSYLTKVMYQAHLLSGKIGNLQQLCYTAKE